jgi:hypothetical protein
MSSIKRRNSALVKLARDHRMASSATDESIQDYLSALNCPKSLAVWMLYKYKEHQQLVDLDISPEDYNCPFAFRDAYAAWAFLSKADFLKIDVSKKDQAFKKFFQYEELCRQTNSRFRNIASDPNYKGPLVWLLHATEQKIAKILGEYEADEIFDGADWGPGVTTKLKGEHVSAINKFHSENGITRDLYSLVGDVFPIAYPGWHSHLTLMFGEKCFDFQIGNTIVTVPKNSKTDRVIAVEPGINLWFQKGIGSMIRRRLRRWGVDLNSQVRNQDLAKRASRDNSLATVDFSSASDSISRELVREIIPPHWYSLLSASRSPFGIHAGKLIRWEKFSSMGNGFTFELESLIFFAAALAVRDYLQVEGEVNVYGDDVILPRACYDLFSEFSAFLGFKVNRDKSFSESYFRESCGVHWYNGIDCKPIFLKERLRNVQSIYKLANGVRMLAHRRNSYYGCDARMLFTWDRLYRRVPKPLRFRSALGLGDCGFVSNFDESAPALATHGIEGYYTSVLVETGVSQYFDGTAVILARLKARSLQEFNNNYTLRGRTKIRINRALVSRWYNLGPWI